MSEIEDSAQKCKDSVMEICKLLRDKDLSVHDCFIALANVVATLNASFLDTENQVSHLRAAFPRFRIRITLEAV